MERGQTLHKPSGDVYHLLGQLLNKYTTRELKMPGDYVFAMAGVCRRLADHAECSLLFGIPVPALDWFLLFYPNKAGLTRRDSFPSWAWSGWYGQVYYDYGSGNVTKWTAASTWITWYKREPSNDVTLVWEKAETRALRAKELFGHLCDVSRTEPSREFVGKQTDNKYSVLHFWTISTQFTLRKIDRDEADKPMWPYKIYWTATTYEVLGKDGASCGFVTLDDAASTSQDSKTAELILLSLSAKSQEADAEGRFFWVLMIEWDKSVAERKGIGKIRRDALASAVDVGISWKEITLA
ncbi:hypothetical protein RRF57_007057 [Xylaria bambusicola]|uniref:Heterokaryon incompatibility protein n=1 Tax=Xylaria bambusicola TaxID=326684 RepID=A0AAN7ZA33_9PEZI